MTLKAVVDILQNYTSLQECSFPLLMMITTALLSQYDWEESQPGWDNVPSQNRVPVTCRWDSVSVTLSPGMCARTPFARRPPEQVRTGTRSWCALSVFLNTLINSCSYT